MLDFINSTFGFVICYAFKASQVIYYVLDFMFKPFDYDVFSEYMTTNCNWDMSRPEKMVMIGDE